MYKTILLATVTLAVAFAFTPAYAQCKSPTRKSNVVINYEEPARTLYLVSKSPSVYTVYDQNPTTCKTTKTVMTEDQLFDVYGVADELETGAID